MNKFLIKFYNI